MQLSGLLRFACFCDLCAVIATMFCITRRLTRRRTYHWTTSSRTRPSTQCATALCQSMVSWVSRWQGWAFIPTFGVWNVPQLPVRLWCVLWVDKWVIFPLHGLKPVQLFPPCQIMVLWMSRQQGGVPSVHSGQCATASCQNTETSVSGQQGSFFIQRMLWAD